LANSLKAVPTPSTTQSGSTLDRIEYLSSELIRKREYKGDLIKNHVNEDDMKTSFSSTGRQARSCVVKAAVNTKNIAADHFGIFSTFYFECCGGHNEESDWDSEFEDVGGDHVATGGGQLAEYSNITRQPCLEQYHNTCGPRAVFNAIQLRDNGDLLAANSLSGIDFGVNIADDEIRNLLTDNNGDDIAIVSSLDEVRAYLANRELAPEDGDQNLVDFANGENDSVTLILNSLSDEVSSRSIPNDELVGHYIAVRLRRIGRVIHAEFADSLSGNAGFQTVQGLIKLLEEHGASPSKKKSKADKSDSGDENEEE
jgi:hypothetical protein